MTRPFIFIFVFALGIIFSVGCNATNAAPTPNRITPTPTAVSASPVPTTATAATSASNSARLLRGPVIGAVTDTYARVFVQTNQAASVQVQYSPDANLQTAQTTEPFSISGAVNPTAQIELRNLKPNTRYVLNVLVNGAPQFKPPLPTFKTFVPQGQATDFSFVVLTDFGWHPTGTFRNASQENPDFVVIGGDFGHSNPTTPDEKRGLFMNHYDHDKLPDFVDGILNRFALAHFWDDHDYGVNNGDKTYAEKNLSLQVLRDFFPTYPMTAYGDWQSFSYGNADFFLLDSRSQRDPDKERDDKNKSMLDGDNLGAEGQYEWLTNGLKNSRATWKFIFTPVPFNPTVPKDDSWYGYQTERKNLVQWIRDTKITGVIFLSGDLHAGGLDNGKNSDFPEMLVPAANSNVCMTSPKSGTWSEGFYAMPSNEFCDGYGVVRVSTNPARVELMVKKENGDQLFKLEVAP